MEEPPAKRARRTDSSAMWERNDTSATSSPRPHDDDRDLRHKGSERDDKRRDGDHRRRSTSRDRNDRKRDRSRSPVRPDRDRDRDKTRDRDRVRDTGRDRDREGRSRRDHDRSRSRDRHRGSKGVQSIIQAVTRKTLTRFRTCSITIRSCSPEIKVPFASSQRREHIHTCQISSTRAENRP
jgi:U4/U6.U5 tri-snRNP-associated protein 3